MSTDTPRTIADLANALQVAAPLAARIRERLALQTEDADALAAAIDRAVLAVKQLQPGNGREGA